MLMTDIDMSPKRYSKTALKEPGMFAWVMHRITGIAILLFFGWHVIDLVRLAYQKTITIGDLQPFFTGYVTMILNGIFLGVIVFHGINGFRVILHDIFPSLNKYYKQIFWIFMILAIIGIVVTLYYMILFTSVIASS